MKTIYFAKAFDLLYQTVFLDIFEKKIFIFDKMQYILSKVRKNEIEINEKEICRHYIWYSFPQKRFYGLWYSPRPPATARVKYYKLNLYGYILGPWLIWLLIEFYRRAENQFHSKDIWLAIDHARPRCRHLTVCEKLKIVSLFPPIRQRKISFLTFWCVGWAAPDWLE